LDRQVDKLNREVESLVQEAAKPKGKKGELDRCRKTLQNAEKNETKKKEKARLMREAEALRKRIQASSSEESDSESGSEKSSEGEEESSEGEEEQSSEGEAQLQQDSADSASESEPATTETVKRTCSPKRKLASPTRSPPKRTCKAAAPTTRSPHNTVKSPPSGSSKKRAAVVHQRRLLDRKKARADVLVHANDDEPAPLEDATTPTNPTPTPIPPYCKDEVHQRDFHDLRTDEFPDFFRVGKKHYETTCCRCKKMFAPNKKDPQKIRPNHTSPMYFCPLCPFKLCTPCRNHVMTFDCCLVKMSA
jgi:hypothetical protein